MARKKIKSIFSDIETDPGALKQQDDMRGNLDRLFRGEKSEKPIYHVVLHRMLVTDRNFASTVKYVARFAQDPELAEGIWLAALPRQSNAPYLSYGAPKTEVAPEPLVARMMEIHCWNRTEAEDALAVFMAMFNQQGMEGDPDMAAAIIHELCHEHGVDVDDFWKHKNRAG